MNRHVPHAQGVIACVRHFIGAVAFLLFVHINHIAMPTLELPPNVDEARARLLIAIGLFQEEELPVGKAAELAGLSYRAFLDVLRERGIPAYSYDDDDATFEAEMETVRALIRERQGSSE